MKKLLIAVCVIAIYAPLFAKPARGQRAQIRAERVRAAAHAQQNTASAPREHMSECPLCYKQISARAATHTCPGQVPHTFHASCMNKKMMVTWMQQHNKCPVCTTPWALFPAEQSLLDALINDNIAHALAKISDPDVDVNLQTAHGNTALIIAAGEGHVSVLEALLARPDIDIEAYNYRGGTALMVAIMQGQGAAVRMLLDHPGIEINTQDDYGYTAFDFALLYHCDEAIIRQMLEAGAQVSLWALAFDLEGLSIALKTKIVCSYAWQKAVAVVECCGRRRGVFAVEDDEDVFYDELNLLIE